MMSCRSEDVKEVSGTEWAGLFRKILEQSIYETLILDIDEGTVHGRKPPDYLSFSCSRHVPRHLFFLKQI